MNDLSAPRRLLAWAVPATLALAVVAPALPAQAAPANTPTSAVVGPVDKDLNGDGVPDLVVVGGTAGLDSGVWAARGRVDATTGVGTGRVKVPAVNIGVHGNGVTGNASPTDFDGAQVITGRFFGTANQDFLAYYPDGVSAGNGSFIAGAGDGTMVKPYGGSAQATLSSDLLVDEYGNVPIQLVNGYTADGADTGIADLMGIVGDSTNGYRLTYYPNIGAPSLYFPRLPLSNATPTGGSDWQNWTLASTELASGTALVLRNATTGDLYLWRGVTMTDNGDGTGTLSYTQYRLASGWNTGVAISGLTAADLNADGVADLWAVFPDGTVRAYLISNLSATKPAKIRAIQAQQLR
ncbi:hypothetical protein OG598_21415 [Micromonospora sp. NBC_00330]|uniref:hypothetical protein n=1 Tax=Micromonospora sp. NBC_00330 TaxID=2903585 RepID=UPI002E2E09A5|nr:hypothetical protein [Micromonospora sp. NBC_00330]